jgi:uncharacterized protein (TIGR03083 family)
MSDVKPLQELVDVWRLTADQVIDLLRQLEPDDWGRPTDLPGWNVRSIAAHMAHLESELAGNPQEHVDVPAAPHIKGLMGQYTEAGPLARTDWPTDRIIDELEQSVAARARALAADPPTDGSALGPSFAALLGWSWETLLTNRPFDLWMHEQDIRRAVGRPGDLDTAGAQHAAQVFAKSLPYVLGKRVEAPTGSTAVLVVTGPQELELAAAVRGDGRGVALTDVPAQPTTRITVDFESWTVLAGGRRTPDEVHAKIEGDQELGRRILANLAVTP